MTEVSPILVDSKKKSGWTRMHEKRFGKRADQDFEERADEIRKQLWDYRPRYLFAYGQANREDYYGRVAKCPLKAFRIVHGTKGRVRIKRSGNTTIVLLPFLGNGRISHDNVKLLTRELRRG